MFKSNTPDNLSNSLIRTRGGEREREGVIYHVIHSVIILQVIFLSSQFLSEIDRYTSRFSPHRSIHPGERNSVNKAMCVSCKSISMRFISFMLHVKLLIFSVYKLHKL